MASAGFWGAAAALLSMAAARGPRTGVAATTATLACAAWARGGFSVNHMDIAPGQAGLVMGVSNTAGTLAGRSSKRGPAMRSVGPRMWLQKHEHSTRWLKGALQPADMLAQPHVPELLAG